MGIEFIIFFSLIIVYMIYAVFIDINPKVWAHLFLRYLHNDIIERSSLIESDPKTKAIHINQHYQTGYYIWLFNTVQQLNKQNGGLQETIDKRNRVLKKASLKLKEVHKRTIEKEIAQLILKIYNEIVQSNKIFKLLSKLQFNSIKKIKRQLDYLNNKRYIMREYCPSMTFIRNPNEDNNKKPYCRIDLTVDGQNIARSSFLNTIIQGFAPSIGIVIAASTIFSLVMMAINSKSETDQLPIEIKIECILKN